MNGLNVLRFFGISLIPFTVAILLHLFFKLTHPVAFKEKKYKEPKHLKKIYKKIIYPILNSPHYLTTDPNGTYWFKQVVIGIIFGAIAIAGYFFGVPYTTPSGDTFLVGNSTVAPVTASFIFGGPAGIISGLIAAMFRVASNDYLRWPTFTALIVCSLLDSIVSHYFFKDKRAKFQYGFLGAIFTETFNILMILVFNISNITEAYNLIKEFAFLCIIFAAFSVAITSITISLIEKERLFRTRQEGNKIAHRVQVWLLMLCSLGIVVMAATMYGISYGKSMDDYNNISRNSLIDANSEILEHGINPDIVYLEELPRHHHVSTSGFIVTIAGEGWLSTTPKQPFEIIGAQDSSSFKPGEIFVFDNGLHLNQIEERGEDNKYRTFFANVKGKEYLICFSKTKNIFERYDKYYIAVIIPSDEVISSAGIMFRVALYIELLVFIALFAFANYFMEKKVVRKIELIDESLERIMDGNLDEELHIEGYEEFTKLSNNINLTVGALKNYAEDIENRMNKELMFAHDIQTNSVPTAFPVEKNYNIYALMQTAHEVGGDFYDYFKMNNGRILFLVADVSGKGVPAAMFMMRARTLIKSLSSTDLSITDIVNQANNELCQNNESNVFVTAWIGILDPNTGELRYVNAGHPNPLIKRNGEFQEFVNSHNTVLAAIENYKFTSEITYLEPGDEIVLYTDGVTEAQNKAKELYGMKRFLDVVRSAKYFNAKQLLDEISDDVVKYAEGEEQFDDMTLLMMRYLGNVDNDIPETAITLKSRPTNASIAVNFVESILAKHELPVRVISQISIVVDELFANIAFYAYPSNHVGEATIQVDFKEDDLYLTFIDSGKQFDPTAPRTTNLSTNIDERKRGGLGIFIVKNTMDEMRYEYVDNRNILHLRKKIKVA